MFSFVCVCVCVCTPGCGNQMPKLASTTISDSAAAAAAAAQPLDHAGWSPVDYHYLPMNSAVQSTVTEILKVHLQTRAAAGITPFEPSLRCVSL